MAEESKNKEDVEIRKVARNGQVTLPKKMRSAKYYKINEGENGKIVLSPVSILE